MRRRPIPTSWPALMPLAVLTYNRRHFELLHRQGLHSGILSSKHDSDVLRQAARIHAALTGRSPGRWCIRVNRPPSP